jgi:hypothetical protein
VTKLRVKKKTPKMLCCPGERKGSTAPGRVPRERLRSEQGENRVGRPENEQTSATRGEAHRARRRNSRVPVCWRDLGGILFLASREL